MRRQDSMGPIPVKRALHKLGQDTRDARRRRRIPVVIMAGRASISRTTLNKIEKGHPGVSLGIYALVLFVLGKEGVTRSWYALYLCDQEETIPC